jgi:hypothetical protein
MTCSFPPREFLHALAGSGLRRDLHIAVPDYQPLRNSHYEKLIFTVTATVWPGVTGTGAGSPFKPSKFRFVTPYPFEPNIGGHASGDVLERHTLAAVRTALTAVKVVCGTTADPAKVKEPSAEAVTVKLAEQLDVVRFTAHIDACWDAELVPASSMIIESPSKLALRKMTQDPTVF